MSKSFRMGENIPLWYAGNTAAELIAKNGDLKTAESICLSSVNMEGVLFLGNPKTAKKVLAISYGQLGNVYVLGKKFKEAEEYYRKALASFLEVDTHSEGIGITYANLGVVHELTDNCSEALKCWAEARFAFAVIGDQWRCELIDEWIKEAESKPC